MFAFALCTTWLMPWYAGFVAVMMFVSGSHLLAAGGIGLTLVMSLYGPGIINRLPVAYVPTALVLLALGLLAVTLRGRLPLVRLGVEQAEP